MAKDYGRNRSLRRGSNKSKQFLQIVMAFLTGYMAACFFDFASLTHWVNNKVLEQQKSGNAAERAEPKQAELPKPKFEFYTLLAKGRTAAPVVSDTRTAPAKTELAAIESPPAAAGPQPLENNTKTNKPLAIKDNWIIQVGSFKTKPEADRMKAGLLLKGYTVSVVSISQPQGNWFRVLIGPYASETEARQVQVSFSKNERVVGMVRKA